MSCMSLFLVASSTGSTPRWRNENYDVAWPRGSPRIWLERFQAKTPPLPTPNHPGASAAVPPPRASVLYFLATMPLQRNRAHGEEDLVQRPGYSDRRA